MTKKTLTNEEFASFIADADDFACQADRLASRWKFGLGDSPKDLERAAQTLNRAVENVAIVQRQVLGKIALEAYQRNLRAELEAAE